MKPGPVHEKIEEALRAERPLRKVSSGFTERVIDALPSRPPFRSQASAAPAVPRPVGPRLLWAGALAVVTLLGWMKFAPSPEPPVLAGTTKNTNAVEKTGGLNIHLASVSLDQVQALSVKIDEPLEKELERVLSDTKNAIRFVASNFMPEN